MKKQILLSLCAAGLIAGSNLALAANGKTLFQEIGASDAEVQAKLNAMYTQMFHGDPSTQALYYLAKEKADNGKDMAYIYNVGNDSVVTEGMSYGMLISAQLNKKTEFDNLWRWAKKYMYHADGPQKGYFAWWCKTDGSKADQGPAPDGEAYFVQALLAASGRWGDAGEFNYRAEAQAILTAMLHQEDDGVGQNMFNKTQKMVKFVPNLEFTDPSYHLPAFYTEWAKYATQDQQFWKDAAATSRGFWKKTVNQTTGLSPDYAEYSGVPHDDYPDGKNNYGGTFQSDAYRTVMNAALDKIWNKAEPGFDWGGQLHNFIAGKNLSVYTVDGQPYTNRDGVLMGNYGGLAGGLVATLGAAAEISAAPNRLDYVRTLYNMTPPTGQWRYYDGMLYMLSSLIASGQMKPYGPGNPNGVIGGGSSEQQTVLVSSQELLVQEGHSATLDVKLSLKPSGPVTVKLIKSSVGDTSLTTPTRTLNFTPENFDQPQKIVFRARQDLDQRDSYSFFAFTAANTKGALIKVIEQDNDSNKPGIITNPLVIVPEGGSARIGVKLSSAPTKPVTVRVFKTPFGDADISAAQNSLVFTPENYYRAQAVDVKARPDADKIDGRADYIFFAPGFRPATSTVRENDSNK